MTSSRMRCNLNAVTETGMQRVVIYWKAVRLRSSRVMASSLYLMCSGMSCQWSSACISCICRGWTSSYHWPHELPHLILIITCWWLTGDIVEGDVALVHARCCKDMHQWHSRPLLNVYRDVSKAMNMVEAGRVEVGSMFLKTKVNQDDNSKGWYSTSWGNHTSELWVVTCHMDDTVLPAARHKWMRPI